MITIYILSTLIILCILLSAFFSGSEMAYSSVNAVRLENLNENGNKKAKRALFISEHFDDALSAILIGNNLVNIAASSIGSVLVITIMNSDSYAWISTVVMTLLIIIFGETIPKITAKKNSTNVSLRNSFSIRFLMIILKPAVVLVVWLVKIITLPLKGQKEDEEDSEESVEELQSIIDTAEDEGVLDSEDSQIIQNAIDFSEIMASEVMTARVDVVAIDIDDPYEEIVKQIESSAYSRIPVYQDSIDNVVGILHINRYFIAATENKDKEVDIKSLLMEPCFVYKTQKLPSVLNTLKTARQHLAVVTDEYSGTLGVVTMEDVLEQIVGDIWDETDTVEAEVIKKNEKEMEIDGDLPISEFLELVGISEDEFEADSETVGGWTVEKLDHFPTAGEKFTEGNFTVTVLNVDGRRVDKVLVSFSHFD